MKSVSSFSSIDRHKIGIMRQKPFFLFSPPLPSLAPTLNLFPMLARTIYPVGIRGRISLIKIKPLTCSCLLINTCMSRDISINKQEQVRGLILIRLG